MRYLILLLILTLYLFSIPAGKCSAEAASGPGKMNVVFINPGKSDPQDPTGGFWREVSTFMEAAAEDLDINLEILYAERNHVFMRKLAEEVLSREVLPDYLMVVNEKLAAGRIITLADSKGVKTFDLLVGFYGKQASEMGAPREKFKNWIGGLIPDNRWGGYQLAKSLIEQALQKGISQRDIRILPIAGDYATETTIERNEGISDIKKDFPEVIILPETHCLWRKDLALISTSKFLHRDPSINVIWAANDPMALGAYEAGRNLGVAPDYFFVGGINWDQPALVSISKGQLSASVGGHFMTGGWGLVMLYDYHHGKDFSESQGPIVKKRIFNVLDKENIKPFLSRFGSRDWSSIDFKKFSKVHNSSLATYNFGIEAILTK